MISQNTVCKIACTISIILSIYAQIWAGRKLATIIVIMTSFFGYIATIKMIPIIKNYMLKAKIFGKDINKVGTEAGSK
jgi:hypothetical protein